MAADDKRQQLRKELLELDAKRKKLESDIRGYTGILSSNKVGMTEPLVDAEGFPRSDIDVYQIRTARNRIVTLQNDCKQIMGEIESKLHELHALTPVDNNPPSR